MPDQLDRMESVGRRLSRSGLGLNVAVVAALLVCAGLSAVLIPAVDTKYVIGFAVLGLVAFLASRPVAVQAFVLLLLITFPITLRVGSKDAATTGTLCILLVLLLNVATHRCIWTRRERLVVGLVLGLILVGGIGAVTGGGSRYWGPELRQWLSLVGGVAVFLLVIGWCRAAAESYGRVIEAIVSALVCVLALHVVLSLVLQHWPSVSSSLSLFRTTGQSLRPVDEEESARATTVFAGGEQFAELLILAFPFSLYKLFRSSGAVYLPVTIILLVGVVTTLTRSAILLVSLEIIMFGLLVLYRRATRARGMAILGLTVVTIVVFSPLYASAIQGSMARLDASLAALQSGSGLEVVLNRNLVWPNAVDVVTKNLSIFGHGPIQAFALGIGKNYNFHSLYLTLVFEFGILGTAVWLLFFVHLGTRLVSSLRKVRFRTEPAGLLVAACLISLLCFLLNEIKFEFNRSDSAEQFVWIVFSIYYASAAGISTYGGSKTRPLPTPEGQQVGVARPAEN